MFLSSVASKSYPSQRAELLTSFPAMSVSTALLESSHGQVREEWWAQLLAYSAKGFSSTCWPQLPYFLQKSGKVIVISHSTVVKNIIFAEDTALSPRRAKTPTPQKTLGKRLYAGTTNRECTGLQGLHLLPWKSARRRPYSVYPLPRDLRGVSAGRAGKQWPVASSGSSSSSFSSQLRHLWRMTAIISERAGGSQERGSSVSFCVPENICAKLLIVKQSTPEATIHQNTEVTWTTVLRLFSIIKYKICHF